MYTLITTPAFFVIAKCILKLFFLFVPSYFLLVLHIVVKPENMRCEDIHFI